MKTATVYALADPRNMTVRYIGSTVNVEGRLKYHISQARSLSRQLREAAGVRSFAFAKTAEAERVWWLAEILGSNLEPLLIVLAVLPEREAREAEKDFIQTFSAHTRLYQRRDVGIDWRPIREIDKRLDAKADHPADPTPLEEIAI